MARLGCQETSGGDSVKIATEESPRFLIEGERRGWERQRRQARDDSSPQGEGEGDSHRRLREFA
jgi:hypothetical protein